MVGYLYPTQERKFRIRPEPVVVRTLLLLGVALPAGEITRRLDRGARALSRQGCSRVLTAPELDCRSLPEILNRWGLAPVDPLPLCRAKADELVMALVEELPFRRRCVALRGENASLAWPAASALCPQVGTLLLDFHRGEEELSRRLRSTYGAATLNLRLGPPPQVSVEYSPCQETAGRPLRLWGRPGLAGLKLTAGGGESLPLLTLLWETGRLGLGSIRVERG